MRALEGPRLLPLALLLGGFLLAALLGLQARTNERAEEQARFRALADRALSQLEHQIRTYEYGLRGARGAIIGSGGEINHDRFVAYSRSRDLSREFPGALGYGFVRRVKRSEEQAFIEANRRDGRPDFAIRELHPHEGERFVLQYLEPSGPNAGVIGLDLASEETRRRSAERALRTGEATLTPPFALFRADVRDEPGLLMILPVYEPGGDGPEDVIGWTLTPLTIRQALTDFDYRDDAFAMTLTDVTDPQRPIRFFASDSEAGAVNGLSARRVLHLYGRDWQVEILARPAFLANLHPFSPGWLAAQVATITTLLVALLYSYLGTLGRRQQLERERERELRASDRQLRDLAESIPHLVWTCEADGSCNYLSPQWVAYTGAPEAEQLGYGWLAHLHPEDAEMAQRRWTEAAATGGIYDVEFRIRRHDGEYRWFKTRACPSVDEAGRITKWFGSNTDIQELRDVHETMARLNRELESRVLARTALLQRTAEQLRSAQRIAHMGSWEMDLETLGVTWSEEMYRIAGMELSDAAPSFRFQRQHLSARSWTEFVEAVERSRTTGEGFVLTLEVLRPNGERRIAITRTEVVRGEQGRGAELVGTLQDVTEIVEARSAMAKLSERLQLATSAAGMGIWDWDIRQDVLVWDQLMYRLYDVSPEQFANTYDAWESRLHPEDRPAVVAAVRQSLAEGRDFDTMFRIVRSDGTIRTLRAVAAHHVDPETGEARMVGVNWDITDQNLIELALRGSEAVLRGILAHAGSSIIATDPQGLVTHFNHAAEKLLGYDASEVLRRCTPTVIHDPEEVESRRRALERELGIAILDPFEVWVARARLGQADTSEWTYLRKDGTRVPVLLTVSALRDDEGEISGFLGVAIDLTSRKLEEDRLVALNRLLEERTQQAEAANQAKSLFLANMSHEIRTPMNAITGISHLLAQSSLTRDQRSLLDTVQSASKTLLGMINDILDLSKIEARQFTLETAPFRLARVLDDVASILAGYAADKPLELVVDADPDLPDHLVGDSLRMIQILANLTANAVRFTDQGHVRLAIGHRALPDDRVELRFEVEDTGTGIDEQMLGRLFSPFTQGRPGIRRAGGTGLGLALVKQLVHLMGGEVGVTSVVGEGSRFWCELPLARGQGPRAEGQPLRVLIVDDNEAQRRALVSAARRWRWTAVAASTEEEAAQAAIAAEASGQPFDAALVDRRLQWMDGLAVLALLRKRSPSLPVVMMASPAEQASLRSDPGASLASGVIVKPITPTGLLSAVTEALTDPFPVDGRTPMFSVDRPSQRLAGVRLLVVDDSDVNREVARRILALEGARVETTDSGRTAAEMVRTRTFDAVLMDIQMDDIDGVEATRLIRETHPSSVLPVLALTASVLASERDRALEAGVNDFVSKPFDPDTLVIRVCEQTERERPYLEEELFEGGTGPPWPSIDGIDVYDAQLRLAGDFGLFRTLLGMLLQGSAELAQPSEGLLQDPARAAELAHRLRGTAGNLGARALMEAAASLEERARGGLGFDEALAGVGRELRRLRAAEETLPERGSEGVPSRERLIQALEEQDLDALEIFQALRPTLRRELGEANSARLEASIAGLDFEAALELLERRPGSLVR